MVSGLRWSGWTGLIAVAVVMGTLSPGMARAQNTLGGHIGVLLPLVTRSGGSTTSVGDPFSVGFPTGITIKPSDRVAFDIEFVPTIRKTPYSVGLTFHPGVIWALQNEFKAGVRAAFDVNQASWGFTPLINRKIGDVGKASLFGELVLPLRFQNNNNSIGLGVHVGVGF
jgi:hypothetical protein